nr:hypothetical protein Iba_chr10aCG3400 [Ipomoea batatas]GME18769.1 hypothetical protein Iba_scaffold21230CG0030 [Ipomoea batatas]
MKPDLFDHPTLTFFHILLKQQPQSLLIPDLHLQSTLSAKEQTAVMHEIVEQPLSLHHNIQSSSKNISISKWYQQEAA